MDAIGEYDEADIEAAYASSSAGDESEGEELHISAEEASLTKQIEKVEQTFMHNLPSATSFVFNSSGCTIGLQVRCAILKSRPC